MIHECSSNLDIICTKKQQYRVFQIICFFPNPQQLIPQLVNMYVGRDLQSCQHSTRVQSTPIDWTVFDNYWKPHFFYLQGILQVPSSLRVGTQDPALPWAPLQLQDEENNKLLLNDFWCNTILFSPFIRLDPLYWYVRLQLACYAQLSFLFWLVFSINTVRFLIFFQMCPISVK